jgi:multidrug resistance protein
MDSQDVETDAAHVDDNARSSQQQQQHHHTPTDSATQSHNDEKDKLVEFQDGDMANPLHWPRWKKWMVMLVISSTSTCVTCTSSVVTTAYEGIQADLHVSREVAILGLSLFVLGLGAGPLLLGPFSEFYGRRPVYLISLAAFVLLGFPVAFANNAAVFFIFRFLTGFAGSAFLSVAGGTVSDLYSINDAYMPMSLYTSSPFLGPVLGPVFSGFIVQYADWRWTFRVIIIWSFVQFLLVVFCAPETFAPQILIKKAKAKRKQTGDNTFYAQHERTLAEKSLPKTVAASSSRVFLLLALEPMLLLLCLWCAILLGILYLFFELFRE